MSGRNWNTNKVGENLSFFLERFLNFADNAVPSPEIEIRIKISAREFYEKYLANDERYFILDIGNNVIHLHCKPRHLLRLIDLEEVEYIDKVSGLYEPM